MGRWILNCQDVVVDAVTRPLEGDRRSRTSFFRRRNTHQEALNRAWKASQETSNYLGEWHTHPEPIPSPSIVDRANWALLLMRPGVEPPALFFAIVGQREIGVWEGNCGRPGTYKLRARTQKPV